LDFPDKKGLQLLSDLLNFEAEKSETMVGFLTEKWIATIGSDGQISFTFKPNKSLKKWLDF